MQDLFGDRPNAECLSRPRAGDYAEAFAAACQLTDARSVMSLEKGLDV
jgi:hypothetical protein